MVIDHRNTKLTRFIILQWRTIYCRHDDHYKVCYQSSCPHLRQSKIMDWDFRIGVACQESRRIEAIAYREPGGACQPAGSRGLVPSVVEWILLGEVVGVGAKLEITTTFIIFGRIINTKTTCNK